MCVCSTNLGFSMIPGTYYVPDTYVPGISRQKSIRTYVMFRPWTHTFDLGPKEACTGLTFVCLSRVKRLVDLMVEPMSFDRIGNLGNSSTMKVRRLHNIP